MAHLISNLEFELLRFEVKGFVWTSGFSPYEQFCSASCRLDILCVMSFRLGQIKIYIFI